MELYKLTTDELRGYDAGKLRETEKGIRKALLDIRMDIYSAPTLHTGKIRGLRKSLARLLTISGSLASAKALGLPVTKPTQSVKTVAKAKSAVKTKTATKK